MIIFFNKGNNIKLYNINMIDIIINIKNNLKNFEEHTSLILQSKGRVKALK